MGNYTSKFLYHGANDKVKQSNSLSLILENQDTYTPKPEKKITLLDPRSATLGIPRTPIEITSTPKDETNKVIPAIPKYLQSKKPYLETNFDVTTPKTETLDKLLDPRSPNVDQPRTPIMLESASQNTTPKFLNLKKIGKCHVSKKMRQKLLGIDPRSPATDFDRTPIPQSKRSEKKRTCSHGNLNTQNNEMKISTPKIFYCETKALFEIPEISVLPDTLTNLKDIESPLGECSELNCTFNVDSLDDNSATRLKEESDCHHTIESKSSPLNNSLKCQDLQMKNEKQGTELIKYSENVIDNILLNAMKDIELKFTEAANKIKIWRDTISPELQKDIKNQAENDVETQGELLSWKENFVIEFDDNDNDDNDESDIQGTVKKAEMIDGKKQKSDNKESEMKRFITPTKQQNIEDRNLEQLKIRTPLRNRSNSNSRLRGGVLKSPHLRRKTPYAMRMHQENTPSNKKKTTLKSRLNRTQWDGDKTIII